MVNQDVITSGTLTARATAWAVSPAVAAPLATSVEVVADPTRFANMGSMWNEAVDRAQLAHPFLRHEWLHSWWTHFGAGRQLHIVVVKSAGRIIAIAPFMWETAHMFRIPVRRLRLMQNDHTPDADVIVAGHAHEAYRAIWRSLLDTSERWDVLLLGEVRRSSPTMTAFRALAADGGHPTGAWPSDDAPYVAITQSWDSYFSSLSPGFRQNLRNRWTRLARMGAPALEVLDDPMAIREACEDALRLEASGWKQTARTSITSDAPTRGFYTELAERASQAGWLRLLFLTVSGRRVAAAYSACYRDRLLYLKTGYDPALAKCSPFKLLTHLALRHAFDTGLAELDFLGTSEPWKREWTSTSRPHDWLFIFGHTARGRLVHQLKFRLKPAVKRWLPGTC